MVEIEVRRGKNVVDNLYFYVVLCLDGVEVLLLLLVMERVMIVIGGSVCGCLLNDWCWVIRCIIISNSILFWCLWCNVFWISGNWFV